MKRILLAGTILAGAMGLAGAADLPTLVKAPSLGPFAVGGSGWYAGIGTEASVENANATGNQIFLTGLAQGSMEATGAAVKGVVGYISGSHGHWWRCEVSAGYQNVTGANNVGSSIAERWSATQECDIGADYIQTLFSALPSLSTTFAFPTFTPSLPGNVAVTSLAPRQYFGALVKEWGVNGQFGTASGTEVAIAPGLKTGFIWQTADATGKSNGRAIDVYASVVWPTKGLTVTGVGATPGGPPLAFGGGASFGPQYSAGIVVDFGI
jgi:hypothetical protein